jgi:DNA modification methylase
MLACQNLNRKGIGIEKEQMYFDISRQRTDDIIKIKQ